MSKACDYAFSKENFFYEHIAMAFPQDSPWIEKFNHEIKLMLQSGLIFKWKKVSRQLTFCQTHYKILSLDVLAETQSVQLSPTWWSHHDLRGHRHRHAGLLLHSDDRVFPVLLCPGMGAPLPPQERQG